MTKKQLETKLIELQQENAKLQATVLMLAPKKSEVTNTNYRYAFEIDGEKFFKWNTVEDIPLSRKIFIDGFIKSTSLIISVEDQKEILSKIVQLTLDARLDEKKRLENIRILSIEIMKRTQMLPLPKMIFRLMAMLYLKESDDLNLDLDSGEIERRAELFEREKKKTLEEIFLQPISNLLGMKAITDSDSNLSSKQKKELVNTLMAQQFIADFSMKAVADL